MLSFFFPIYLETSHRFDLTCKGKRGKERKKSNLLLYLDMPFVCLNQLKET